MITEFNDVKIENESCSIFCTHDKIDFDFNKEDPTFKCDNCGFEILAKELSKDMRKTLNSIFTI